MKPGGVLVYSTCTLNKQENEYILNWALENLDVEMLEIDLHLKEAMKASNENLNININKAIKILPSKNTEGFFVAKLKRKNID